MWRDILAFVESLIDTLFLMLCGDDAPDSGGLSFGGISSPSLVEGGIYDELVNGLSVLEKVAEEFWALEVSVETRPSSASRGWSSREPDGSAVRTSLWKGFHWLDCDVPREVSEGLFRLIITHNLSQEALKFTLSTSLAPNFSS